MVGTGTNPFSKSRNLIHFYPVVSDPSRAGHDLELMACALALAQNQWPFIPKTLYLARSSQTMAHLASLGEWRTLRSTIALQVANGSAAAAR